MRSENPPARRVAVYSGTFDPLTLGHEDVARRAVGLFDELILAVAMAHHKKTRFSLQERMAMAAESLKDLPVRVLPFDGLIMDFCREHGACAVVRGIRNLTDFGAFIDLGGFDAAANLAYQFVWGTFCDWHLEFAKPIFQGADEAAKAETRAATAWVLDVVLHVLHPFMPFITEELWGKIGNRTDMLMTRPWPKLEGLHNPGAEEEMDWVVRVISTIRGVRSVMNVPPSAQVDLLAAGLSDQAKGWAKTHEDLLVRLARLASLETQAAGERIAQAFSHGAVQMVVDGATLVMPLAGIIDLDKERARLEKELARVEAEVVKVDRKLGNPDFVAKAAPEVVEENRERRDEWLAAKAKLEEAMARLSGA